jgi:hypothetical protein
MTKRPSLSDLQEALSAAGSAHHDFEQHALRGVHDEQWAGFYAAYVLGRLGDFTTATLLTGWLEGAPSVDDWSAAAASYVLGQLAG